MRRKSIFALCVLAVSVVLCVHNVSYGAIPQSAIDDPLYTKGYLVCDHYANVASDDTGNSTTGLNTCLNDAFLNALTAYLAEPCGVYRINDTLRAYEWQNWSGSAALNPDPRIHNFRGAKGICQPTIKLIASSSGFTDAGSPRPMMAFRNFLAKTSNAVANAVPSNPLGLPGSSTDWKDGQANQFSVLIENIKFDTNDNAGAIGLTFPSAQNSGAYSITIDATNSFAGMYGLPGRNSTVVNLTVTGGQHCVGGGSVWGLSLDNSNGNNLFNVTCTGQTSTPIEINDGVPTVIAGLSVVKSSNGEAIRVRSPFVLQDAKFEFSGSAANDIAIDNPDGRTMYVRTVYFNGTTNAIRSLSTTTVVSGTWGRAVEYSYTNQHQEDGSTQANVFPTYQITTPRDTTFESRSVIDGTLSQAAFPVLNMQNSAGAPPTDLLSRHGWTSLPSIEDGTFTNPDDYGDCNATVVTPGYGQDGADGNTGPDCTAELQQAIDDAATAGHNRVHLPRGVIAVSGSVNLKPNTKLMGAGIGLINMIAYKSTWAPTTETYYLTTDSNSSGTAYMGFFSLFARTNPVANQFTAFWHWRIGKDSLTVNIGYEKQHNTPSLPTNGLKMVRFSGNGGGRHYGIHNSFEQYDSHSGARMVYAEGTTQPLSLYGQNIEITKVSTGGAVNFADANIEFVNVSNARIYGCKREGQSPSLIASDSDNIAIYGCGAMTGPLIAGKNGWYQFTGVTDNVLAAVHQVRSYDSAANGEVMIREDIDGLTAVSTVPWPNGLSLYKRGQIDDAPFGSSEEPSPTAPEFLSATVNAADRLDVCWAIFDSTAMVPSSATTGWTVTVDAVGKAVTSSTLTGLNCYQLNFAGSTITTGTQAVVVSYAPGNITAGGAGTPAAKAFTNETALNLLSPTPNPVYTQASFAFRAIVGDETVASSPWYIDESSSHENVNARFVQGAFYRIRFKIVNTVAAAPDQSFFVCVSENGGAYGLLTDSCASAGTCFADAPGLASGSPTTELLTEAESTYVPGGFLEESTTLVPVILTTDSETEYEAAIRLKDDVAVGNTYDYRMCRIGGAAFDAYTNTARVTVTSKRAARKSGAT